MPPSVRPARLGALFVQEIAGTEQAMNTGADTMTDDRKTESYYFASRKAQRDGVTVERLEQWAATSDEGVEYWAAQDKGTRMMLMARRHALAYRDEIARRQALEIADAIDQAQIAQHAAEDVQQVISEIAQLCADEPAEHPDALAQSAYNRLLFKRLQAAGMIAADAVYQP